MDEKPSDFFGKSGKSFRISVSFPNSVYSDLKKIARQKKVSLAWVIRDAVESYTAAEASLKETSR